jgi:hypothetical protein
MFRTAAEDAHAYDAAMWKFGRVRSKLNFPKVKSAEKAQFLAVPALLETAKADEWLMVEHRHLHPEDVAREEEFWAQKKKERRVAHAEKRRKKAWIEAEYNNPNTELEDKDPHWLEYNFLTSEESTDEE